MHWRYSRPMPSQYGNTPTSAHTPNHRNNVAPLPTVLTIPMGKDGELAAKRAMPSTSSGGGPDLISSLHDELLLQVLVCLPIVDAIRTCLLSRRWRHLWTRLPQLSLYDDVGVQRFADLVDGVLGRYASHDIPRLSLSITDSSNLDASRLSSWVRLAAGRVTDHFFLCVRAEGEEEVVLQLPCCEKATAISLCLFGELRLRTSGAFACLTQMFLCGVRFTGAGADPAEIVSSCCPRLETLALWYVSGVEDLRLHSASLLSLELKHVGLVRLDVAAAKLRTMDVLNCYSPENGGASALVCRAPALQELFWEGCCPDSIQFGDVRCLQKLSVCDAPPEFGGQRSNFAGVLGHFRRADCLLLHIRVPDDLDEHKDLIMEQIKLPDHSELELLMTLNGHRFEGSILSLLKRCRGLKKLQLCLFDWDEDNVCSSNCICHHPTNWRDQNICFDSMEELVAVEYKGTRSEKEFLNFLMRRATVLKTLTVAFSKGIDHPSLSGGSRVFTFQLATQEEDG